MGNALALTLELLQVALAAAQLGVEIANIVQPAIAKVKAAQAAGVDLTDQDLADQLAALRAQSAELSIDPGASST